MKGLDFDACYDPETDLWMRFVHEDLPGIVQIYYDPNDKEGMTRPEVEYESSLPVGLGTPAQIRLAVKAARAAMEEFTKKTGRRDFVMSAYTEDGFGDRRERFFKKVFPDVEVDQYFPEETKPKLGKASGFSESCS